MMKNFTDKKYFWVPYRIHIGINKMSFGKGWNMEIHISEYIYWFIFYVLWQSSLMTFKCVKYCLLSMWLQSKIVAGSLFGCFPLFALDILIINTPMNKQFCALVWQNERGTDFKPMEIGFPEPSNEIKWYYRYALCSPEGQVYFSIIKNFIW